MQIGLTMFDDHYSDELLLQLIRQKDAKALERLYERHGQIIHNMVMRIVSDPAMADEIVQETFWQVWKEAANYTGLGSATAWIYHIARRKSIDIVHTRNQLPSPQNSSLHSASQAGNRHLSPGLADNQVAATATTEAGTQIDRQHLLRALASIPGEQRVCLDLAYYEGLSQSQISEHLSVPLGTVKTRVRMGLEKLEHILEALGNSSKGV